MMIQNKPYLWLNSSGRSLVVKIKLWCQPDMVLTSDVPVQDEDDDTLRLVYKLDSGISADPYSLEFNLLSGTSYYDSSRHVRVTVIITDAGGNILGLNTVKPRIGTFSVSGAGPEINPYLYIQSVNTTEAVVHVAGWVDGAGEIAEVYPHEDDYTTFERKVEFKVGAAEPIVEILTEDHNLDEGTNYDPVLDSIVVSLVEYNSDGTEKRKGVGTVHTSEADASSDE